MPRAGLQLRVQERAIDERDWEDDVRGLIKSTMKRLAFGQTGRDFLEFGVQDLIRRVPQRGSKPP